MVRSCDECTACCTVIEIKSMKSPQYQDCVALCESGCKIYDQRPGECRQYRCMWLMGWGDEDQRPDICGYIMDMTKGGIPIAWEIVEGAAQSLSLPTYIRAYKQQRQLKTNDKKLAKQLRKNLRRRLW